jgi:hypothetical protein
VKVKEIMERAGITETGRALAYIKDGLEELNLEGEAQVKTDRIDIKQNKRFYTFPIQMWLDKYLIMGLLSMLDLQIKMLIII